MRPSHFSNQSSPSPASSAKNLIRGAAAGLLATAILSGTGCKSMPFSIPKPALPKLTMPKLAKPDMSKLAFWKSENLMPKKGNLPKPPSRSFDPAPFKESIASAELSAQDEMDSIRNEVARKRNKLSKPLRKPYSLDSDSTTDKLASNKKLDFDGSTTPKKLPNFDIADTKITKAQRDFQAALASSSKAIEDSIGSKVEDLKTASNDFKLPGVIKKTKANVEDSLMAVNKSLYNSKGQLAAKASNAAADASNAFNSSANKQLSLFEQRLKQVAEKTKTAPATLAKSATDASSNAFGGITLPKTGKAQGTDSDSALAAASSEVAELKAQIAQLRAEQQKLIQQQLTASQSTPSVNAQLKSSTTQSASNSPSSSKFVTNLTARPDVGQSASSNLPLYPSNTPLRTADSSTNFASSTPANVLRGNFSPIRSGSNYQVPVEQTKAPTSTTYPSTQYGSYGSASGYSANVAPTKTPSQQASQASFQQNGNKSNLVITASTPVEPVKSHVSDVNIPEAVLRGTSNYAPGSVHPLR